MWSKTLLEFSAKIYKEFGNHPIDNIKWDYDKITFQLGRTLYQYDLQTGIISPLEK